MLLRSLARFKDRARESVKRIPATIVVDLVFVLGIVLFGYGAEQLQDGAGALAVGVLLVLYVKPLVWWWRR